MGPSSSNYDLKIILDLSLSKNSATKLLDLMEHLVANCFSQNPLKKSNNQAHLRIVYLRALLNLFKTFIRIFSAK